MAKERPTWGIIDVKGNFLVGPCFEEVGRLSDGVFWAIPHRDGQPYKEFLKYRPYNLHGHLLSAWALKSPQAYSCGLMPIKVNEDSNDSLWQYIDKAGRIAIGPRFAWAGQFESGYAPVMIGGKSKLIDVTGKILWEAPAGKLVQSDEQRCVANVNGRSFLLSTANSDEAIVFEKWLLQDLSPIASLSKANKFGYINRQGKMVIDAIFDEADEFSDGLAQVKRDGKLFYIDASGKKRLDIPNNIVTASAFLNERAIVCIKEADSYADMPSSMPCRDTYYSALMDKSGRIVSEEKFFSLSPPSGDGPYLAATNSGGIFRYGYVDRDGSQVVPFKFSVANDFYQGYSTAALPLPSESAMAPKPEMTVGQFDQALRKAIRDCLGQGYLNTRICLRVNIESGARVSVDLIKGTGSAANDAFIKKELSALRVPAIPGVLQGSVLNLSYVVDAEKIVGCGSASDPFRDLQKNLADTASACQNALVKGENSVELTLLCRLLVGQNQVNDPADTERSEINRIFYLACQDKDWALASLAQKMEFTTDIATYHLLIATLADHKIPPCTEQGVLRQKLDILKARRCQNVDKHPADIVDALIALGNFYYNEGELAKAGDFFKEAASQPDGPSLAADNCIANNQYGHAGIYHWACFLAMTDRIADSEKQFDRVLAKVDSFPNMSYSVWTGWDNFQTYLNLLKLKDPSRYSKYLAAIEPKFGNYRRLGLIDLSGAVVKPPSFGETQPFSEGLAAASVLGRWGFIDKNGDWIIEPIYEDAGPFGCSLAPVRCKFLEFPPRQYQVGTDNFVYIDRAGKIVLPAPQDGYLYSYRHPFTCGLTLIGKRDGANNFGYSDTQGRKIDGPKLHAPVIFANNVARGEVAVDEVTSNTDGTESEVYKVNLKVIDSCSSDLHAGVSNLQIHLDGLNLFFEGEREHRKWGYKDPEGLVEISPKYDAAREFSEGLAAVKIGKLWGYIDDHGEMVINPRFSEARSFEDGAAYVYDTKSGECCIDKSGREIFKNFSGVLQFRGGLSAFQSPASRKWGVVSCDGKIVVQPGFDDMRQYSDGMAAINVKGLWGFIDTTGSVIIPPKYASVTDFSEGLAFFELPKLQ
ncbi:MAG: WG repeat-containing protein [Cyanobacteria bacterium REEB67]|nr:WG repeat-containing protein [Cyanobacteria bacterium REEB67]